MQIKKIMALLFIVAMTTMPQRSLANSPLTDQASGSNIVKKTEKTATNRSKSSATTKKSSSTHKKVATSSKTKESPTKINETKKLYGVKGATLSPTKVNNKVYRYQAKGKTHTSMGKEASRLFSQTGIASYYGKQFHGNRTASGEIFNKNGYTAAHKKLALGSYALVTNLRNGRKVIVKINDRGPFSHGRVIDLSTAAAREIGMIYSGTARVKIEAMQVDKQGYISGKGAEALYKLAKRKGLNLKIKGHGTNLAIKAK